MVIQHNMAAANTNRQLGITSGNLAKSTEKLSSGYRINRAGDDAAGLSISEKMRGQIRGLDQASTNAQDGISLIQTAEGALDETHSILQRMRELSVQAANDTNTAEDRDAITKEITALTSEIDRISETTEFNTQGLLDGTFNGSFQIGANSSQTIDVSIGKVNSASLGLTGGVKLDAEIGVAKAGKLVEGSYTVDGDKLLDSKGNQVGAIVNTTGKATITLADSSDIVLTNELSTGASIEIKNSNTGAETADVAVTLAKATGTTAENLAAGNYQITGTNLIKDGVVIATTTAAGSKDYTLSNGKAIDLSSLGLATTNYNAGDKFTIQGVDVTSSDKASSSLTTIDAAIQSVSSQRSSLGAIQNRLEHTISNLDNSSENLQSAESRIRDVDMASEMVTFSKNNILQQAAQSMLAQANQQTQGVLSLLQ